MLNHALTIFLSATLPIIELRGAIPLGLYFELPMWQVYVLAVAGNMLPIFFLLWFWETLAGKLSAAQPAIGGFFQWLFERTRKKFYAKHKKWGEWALVIFVAIPLPITGAWTGSVAAFLFGIPYRRALGLIFLGVLISGIIVTLVATGLIRIFSL